MKENKIKIVRSLKEEIIDILYYQELTFVELERSLKRKGYSNINGNYVLLTENPVGAVLWMGMSKEFQQTMIQLINEDRVGLKGCTVKDYTSLVEANKLPVAQLSKPSLKGRLKWLPVTLIGHYELYYEEDIEGITKKFI